MKSKTLVALMISIGCGIVAAVGIMRAIGNDSGSVVEKTLPVLLANDFLDIRTPLNSENCHIENWPAKLVPPEAVADLTTVEGKFNRLRLSKGLPIMLSQIADQTFFDRDLIPPGHKVVAVKVNEDDTISGLLKPGQQVDIIGIVDAESEDGRRSRRKVAQTFLKAIRVYSIDGARDGSVETAQPGRRGNAVVGILVTEKQSEQIVLVQRVGALKLVLRGSNTDADPNDQPDFVSLFPDLAKPGSRKKEMKDLDLNIKKSEEPDFVMTVYNGTESTAHEFDIDGQLVSGSGSRIGGGGSGRKSSRASGGSSSSSAKAGSANRNQAAPEPYESGADDDIKFDDSDDFSDSFEEDQYLGE